MNDAVIVDAVRTPVGKRNGGLSGVHPVDLSAHVLRALTERNDLDPSTVDDVLWGCVSQVGEQAGGVGRYAVLAAGWPESVTGVTVDRACGSSQQSLHFAAAGIISGHYDIAVAGGVESMSRVPIGSARSATQFGKPFGPLVRQRYNGVEFNQGVGAEMIAENFGLTRTQLDQHALDSHERAAAAIDSGAFENQISPVKTTAEDGTVSVVDTDEASGAGRLSRDWAHSPHRSRTRDVSPLPTRHRSPTAPLRCWSPVAHWRHAEGGSRSPESTPWH